MTTNELQIFPDALVAEAPADLTIAAFASALIPQQLCFPPDPLDRTITLRHMLDNHMGGRRRLRYGTFANYLRGATLVTSGGNRLALGGQTVKNVTGYALGQLLVGAKGRYGTVETLTLSLRPLPLARWAMVCGFLAIEQACAAANALVQAGLRPNALALLDAPAQAYVVDALVVSPVGALLLVEFDGHPQALERQLGQARILIAQHQGVSFVAETNNETIAACWRAWEQLELRLVAQHAPGIDLLLPRRFVPTFVARARAIAHAYRMELLIWGDLGVGNLHPTLLGAARPAEAHTAALLMWRAAQELGGTLGGERGNTAVADVLGQNASPHELLAAAVALALATAPDT